MTAPGKVRIVGGLFRRTVVPVPNVRNLRPTPDRVRESVFSWLDPYITSARCLDLFSGSGALGIEAASRGAQTVLVNDANRDAYRSIKALVDKLAASSDAPTRKAAQSIDVRNQDAVSLLNELIRDNQRFDLIFLDPPFQSALLEATQPLISSLLATGGALYLESDQPFTEYAGLQTAKSKKSGQVHYHLLNFNSDVELA
jgi:16S rRNA (guanine966-N2)-methyltransferase